MSTRSVWAKPPESVLAGSCPNHARGQVPRECGTQSARGTDRQAFPQQLLLASQAVLDLLYEGIGQAQVAEGLFKGLDGPLRLVTLETLMGFAASTSSRVAVCFGVSCVAGHGHLPRTVVISMPGMRAIVYDRSHVPAGSELATWKAIRRRPTGDVSPYATPFSMNNFHSNTSGEIQAARVVMRP